MIFRAIPSTHMRTAFILWLLATSSTTIHAQCKYQVNEYDKFQKYQRVITHAKARLNGSSDNIYFRRVADRYFIDLDYEVLGVVAHPAGSRMMMMLANDSIITAYATGTELSTAKAVSGILMHRMGSTYSIAVSDLEMMRGSKITSVRIQYTDSFRDFNIKEPHQLKLQQAISCLLDAPVVN